VGRVIRATLLPNGGVQTKADLLAVIDVIGRQKVQLDCRSRHFELLAEELGFHDFCYPAQRARKRQRSLSSDPVILRR